MTADWEMCAGAANHAPAPLWTERHHVFPKFLSALLGIPVVPNLVPLCGNCHGRVHHALAHLINSGAVAHRLSPSEALLVSRAWDWWQESLGLSG